jgi:hypothetical protein
MEQSAVIKILILAEQTSARLWAGMVRDFPAEVWLSRDEVPRDAQIDVLLVDFQADDWSELAEDEVGVLRAG